jgi:hypothetical protein
MIINDLTTRSSLLAVLTIHLLLSWDWIVPVTRRFIGKINNQSRINYIINWLLFIDGTVIMFSGFFDKDYFQDFFGKAIMTFSPFPASLSADSCPPCA